MSKLAKLLFVTALLICLLVTLALAASQSGGDSFVYSDDESIKDEIWSDTPSIVYGDADNDGNVNSKDLVLLRKYLANFNPLTGESTAPLGPAN